MARSTWLQLQYQRPEASSPSLSAATLMNHQAQHQHASTQQQQVPKGFFAAKCYS